MSDHMQLLLHLPAADAGGCLAASQQCCVPALNMQGRPVQLQHLRGDQLRFIPGATAADITNLVEEAAAVDRLPVCTQL